MSKTDNAKCSNFFVIAFLIVFIHSCTSAPVNVIEDAYTQFVAELNRNKCSFPSQVQLPFDTTQANNFEYFSSFLKICHKTESAKRDKEAVVLCKEIFDNIRNISCPTRTALPDIISVNLSQNVCQGIGAVKASVPEDDKSLLKRLTDGFLCDIMCDSEFEKACQVLLWSFQVRKQIASLARAQEPEQPNVLGDGGNTKVDSFKQGNTVDGNTPPEIIDQETEERNAQEAKDLTEVVGHNGIAEIPEPSKLEDNPDEKRDTPLISDGKEKPVPNDKGTALENPAALKVTSRDSTAAFESTSSSKTPSSVSQLKPDIQAPNSNTDGQPVEETAKGASNDQNVNKELQSDITKYNGLDAGGDLPQTSNTDIITGDQTPDVNGNTLADTQVQDKKDTVIRADDHPQGDSPIPANQGNPVDGGDGIPRNEIPGETPEKGDHNSNLPNSIDLPHESANEESPNDASADLHNEQNPSNLVNTIDPNKPQSTGSNDGDLVKKTDSPTTKGQTINDTTQHQTLDETGVARVETKADQSQTNSVSKKVEETQNHVQTDATTHDLVTGGGAKNPSTDQKEQKGAQQTEKLDNTIPDTTETSINIDEKPPEKSEVLKPAAVNPDGKSVVPSSLETSTKTTVALEKMEGGNDPREPADEEADHYGEPENTEGDDYNGQDYDGSFGEVSRNKASNQDVPSPITAAKEIITNQYERPMEFPSRNAFGQDSSSIQLISSFPEQEDSHFFFYFLSMVLILMAGYLVFHNKQKIIALIVEGRHERNRRSHRIGYKKLETK